MHKIIILGNILSAKFESFTTKNLKTGGLHKIHIYRRKKPLCTSFLRFGLIYNFQFKVIGH